MTAGRWKNALLLLFSVVLSIAFGEVVARLFLPVRDVGPLFTVNDPVMGKRIKKSFHTVRVTPDFTMTFTSNSLGFRGPEPDGAPRNSIVFLGDSFTMGFGVSDGEEFPALVGADFDRAYGKGAIGVVNMGMGDNGNGRWIKLLRTEVDRFRPRLVVLQVMANDFDDNLREGYFHLTDAGALEELPIVVNPLKSLEPVLDAIPGLSSSYLYSFARQAVANFRAGRAPDAGPQPARAPAGGPGYADRLTERLVAESLALCRAKGYPAFAILVGLRDERRTRMEALLRDARVPWLTVPDKPERPDLYFRVDGHWNRAGHAYVARELEARLRELRLVPAP